MSARREVTLAVVAWVVVVVIGAGLVWFVISRAGTGVTGGGEDPLPAAEPATRARDLTSPTASPTSSASDPSSTPAATADPVRGTWQGAPGVVSVECRGSSARLTGAAPNSGYAVEVDDSGPGRIRVEFESEERDLRTRVEATCVAGAPSFTEDD